MIVLTLKFLLAGFVLLGTSRLLLAVWHWERVRKAGGLKPIVRGGLRIDAAQLGMIVVLPLLLAPWLGHLAMATNLAGWWFQLAWLLLVLMEASTPQFLLEYETRPNRLYVEYLKHPHEVLGMLWHGYRGVVLAAIAVILLFAWLGHVLFADHAPDPWAFAWWQKAGLSLVGAGLSVAAIRGTLAHRPINPSTVVYCADSMLNTLPLNSLYSVNYALYSMKNERSAEDVYGHMDEAEVNRRVVQAAGIVPLPETDIPTLHKQIAFGKAARPRKLVLIVEESLGAQYVGNLGGMGLTPALDALACTGWNFTKAYATGTRSVRGLEAVAAGFPPTLSDAVLRLSGAQSGFFTLANLLGQHGYHSRFIYGGEAHFDNMKSFFMGNGFNELCDRSWFEKPAFVGTWGVSDEDMFDGLHRRLLEDGDAPTLSLAFSVSNHTPWEYPAGRIAVDGDPATVENTVRYADWALGRFFEQARRAPYWEDTLFVVVADHDARVGGAALVPLRHFHIPAVIVGGGVEARRDERVISQIDLAPTLLSMMGIDTEHPMIGHDLGRPEAGHRAMMQYGENYGYLRGDILTVLEPHRPPSQYRYEAPGGYEARELDEDLAHEALAHALWPTMVYRKGLYTLPGARGGVGRERTPPSQRSMSTRLDAMDGST